MPKLYIMTEPEKKTVKPFINISENGNFLFSKFDRFINSND